MYDIVIIHRRNRCMEIMDVTLGNNSAQFKTK